MAKRKRNVKSDNEDLAEPYLNDTHFVHFDKFGQGIIGNGDGIGQVLVNSYNNSTVETAKVCQILPNQTTDNCHVALEASLSKVVVMVILVVQGRK